MPKAASGLPGRPSLRKCAEELRLGQGPRVPNRDVRHRLFRAGTMATRNETATELPNGRHGLYPMTGLGNHGGLLSANLLNRQETSSLVAALFAALCPDMGSHRANTTLAGVTWPCSPGMHRCCWGCRDRGPPRTLRRLRSALPFLFPCMSEARTSSTRPNRCFARTRCRFDRSGIGACRYCTTACTTSRPQRRSPASIRNR
jgi:hypothetical protein